MEDPTTAVDADDATVPVSKPPIPATTSAADNPPETGVRDGRRARSWRRLSTWTRNDKIAAVGSVAGIVAVVIAYATYVKDDPPRTNVVADTSNSDNLQHQVNTTNNYVTPPGSPPAPPVPPSTTVASSTVPWTGGWGPDRPLFSIHEPAPYPALNSITDNPAYGDTRDFVSVKRLDAPNAQFTNLMRAEPGDVLQVYVWVANDCRDGTRVELSTMHGLTANLLNDQSGTDVTFGVRLDADNAKSVYDGASVITHTRARLAYVSGSAEMYTADAQFPLADDSFTSGGMLLGQFKQDGEYAVGRAPNGQERAAGYILFQLRVEPIGAVR